ncbi:HPF/RaiA family ribosome-associated protein [Granulicella arctica]|uniref:HPF/RaiA family ribosome-associated protein n=1 Tax=Granulicella arctica TaxID=940613 RepID=UPI0021DFE33B|nr:HPF/RaiA family ribosome-associated protein [Granulicella arctica]
MQILVNSDKHIVVHRKLSHFVDIEINRILNRFNPHLTRVEAHLSDEHAFKAGPRTKRCLLEARPKEHQSLTVTADSPDLLIAVTGAAHKMQRLLDSTFGRIEEKRSVLAVE